MDDFVILIKKDSRIRVKINDVLDRYDSLPYDFQSKIGYKVLIQNVILGELINMLATMITDLDIELKMKNSRINV